MVNMHMHVPLKLKSLKKLFNVEVKISNLNHYLPETKSKKNQDFLSDPQLAMAMKEGTKVVHSAAENSLFTKYV
jgi:uncharacterized protein (UPF0216 family)